MNEVVAHLASARLGGARSTPTTTSTSASPRTTRSRPRSSCRRRVAIEEELIPALIDLQEALAAKADEFWDVVKTGRTHLQDATPIRLGQEFAGYAGQVEEAIRRAQAARDELLTVPLGGTAVGTGINAHPEYAARACGQLSELTGPASCARRPTTSTPRRRSTRRSRPTAALRAIALGLWKIASATSG